MLAQDRVVAPLLGELERPGAVRPPLELGEIGNVVGTEHGKHAGQEGQLRGRKASLVGVNADGMGVDDL